MDRPKQVDGNLDPSRNAAPLRVGPVRRPVPVPMRPAGASPSSPRPEASAPAETLEAFFGQIRARAFRFAEIGLRNRDDALDAVQDAMTRMLGYRERPAAEWTALFWTILRSRIVDAQRRRMFRLGWMTTTGEEEREDLDWADAGPDPARAHEGREAYAQLLAALRELPRRQREAFGLRVLEELDVATTARAMGCSEGSVKTHLSRAREALQKRLEDYR